MAWPSTVSTTNLDNGADSAALARADIKAAIDALNTIKDYRGVADGFPATDGTGQQILGTNFVAGVVSGSPTITFDSGDKWVYNRTSNALEVYKDSALICSIPFATFNSVANLDGWASIIGTGLAYSSSKLVLQAPIVKAYNSTTQAITANTDTILSFNSEEVDTDSWFNTSTGKFQPTIACWCELSARATVAQASLYSKRTVWIAKNGTSTQDQDQFYSGRLDDAVIGFIYTPKSSSLVYFNGTTDYAQVYFRANTNCTLIAESWGTRFEAKLVRTA